jgi:hypothetical protein
MKKMLVINNLEIANIILGLILLYVLMKIIYWLVKLIAG